MNFEDFVRMLLAIQPQQTQAPPAPTNGGGGGGGRSAPSPEEANALFQYLLGGTQPQNPAPALRQGMRNAGQAAAKVRSYRDPRDPSVYLANLIPALIRMSASSTAPNLFERGPGQILDDYMRNPNSVDWNQFRRPINRPGFEIPEEYRAKPSE